MDSQNASGNFKKLKIFSRTADWAKMRDTLVKKRQTDYNV